MNQDLVHLQRLSIFYYLGAAFALCGCAAAAYLGIISGEAVKDGFSGGDVLLMRGIMGFACLLCAALAVCMFLTGKYLVETSHYKLCTVMAWIVAFVSVPVGTVLGVLTLVVLSRPSVKSLFGVLETPPPVPAHS